MEPTHVSEPSQPVRHRHETPRAADLCPVYRVGLLSDGLLEGVVVRIPKGFLTDLASVPWPLRWLMNPKGPQQESFAMHDYLYTLAGCSRWLADSLMRQAMADQNAPVFRRIIVFYLVRLFGWAYRRPEPSTDRC